jgi:hypothetical protein
MSYDEMKDLWKSPANRPTPSETEQHRETLVRSLRREHRGFCMRLGIAMAMLLVPVVRLAWFIVEGGAFALTREWAVLLLLLIPWVGALMFIRRHLQHRRAHAGFEQSVSRAVRALLDANHAAQQRGRVIQGLLALSAPVMALCIWQLQVVGKARPHEAASLATVMAIIIAASFGGIYWEIRRLRPEERRLAALVSELE